MGEKICGKGNGDCLQAEVTLGEKVQHAGFEFNMVSSFLQQFSQKEWKVLVAGESNIRSYVDFLQELGRNAVVGK